MNRKNQTSRKIALRKTTLVSLQASELEKIKGGDVNVGTPVAPIATVTPVVPAPKPQTYGCTYLG